MESNAKPLFGHYENINCPNCESVELIWIKDLDNAYFHVCMSCCFSMVGLSNNSPVKPIQG